MKPTLYLMVGYPGAGKTTVAQYIAALTGAQHVWADKERLDMFGTPTHSPLETKQLYDVLNKRVIDMLATGNSVVYDTNFNHRHDRQRLTGQAAAVGARTIVVWITTSDTLAKQRAMAPTHDQPTRILGSFEAEVFDRIAGHLEPPQADEHVVQLMGTSLTQHDVAVALGLAG